MSSCRSCGRSSSDPGPGDLRNHGERRLAASSSRSTATSSRARTSPSPRSRCKSRSETSPASLGDEISEEKPLLDSRLPDGSRVAAVFPPCSVAGTTLTIRKFHNKRYTADELVRIGTLTLRSLNDLRDAVEKRQNILITGGTGTGKTTLLNALAAFIPDGRAHHRDRGHLRDSDRQAQPRSPGSPARAAGTCRR